MIKRIFQWTVFMDYKEKLLVIYGATKSIYIIKNRGRKKLTRFLYAS